MEKLDDDYSENLHKKIIAKIKEVRREKKISQTKMAEALGITQTTYSDIELGRVEMGIRRMIIALKYLNIDNIFQDDPDPKEIKDLTVINDFESFLKKFLEQSQAISRLEEQNSVQSTELKKQSQELSELRKENTEIKALLHLVLQKLSE